MKNTYTFVLGILAGVILASILIINIVDDTFLEEHLPRGVTNALSVQREVITENVEDQCGIVLGKLVHTIPTEDQCAIKCRNKCETEGKSYVGVKFTPVETSCHLCACSCK